MPGIKTPEEVLGTEPKEAKRLVKVDQGGRIVVPDLSKVVDESGNTYVVANRRIQGVIDGPPASQDQLYKQACSNDEITVSSWRDQWIAQTKANSEKYDFVEMSAMQVFQKEKYKPVILAGSGPSLKWNYGDLKNRKDIRIVSCLHNFGFFEDNGIMGPDDYYLNLDAGDITIRETFEGSKLSEEECWAKSKDRTLLTHVVGHPELLEKWQGRILFYCTPVRADLVSLFSEYIEWDKVPPFNVGGNALGACLYAGKALLGGGVMIFVGADFSFDRTQKFHAWNSPYDAQFSGVVPATDIFGDRVYTWASYFNFKSYMDYMAVGGKGNNTIFMVNATEGGILGAYPQGNIKQIIQMDLATALYQFNMTDRMPELMGKEKEPVLLF